MNAKKGMKVMIEYTGKLEDGTVFDSSEKHGAPLEFTLGEGKVIKGLETAIEGMSVGEGKEVRLMPADAYGDVNPGLIKAIPRERLKGEVELKEGMMMVMGLSDGNKLPAKVVKVSQEEVQLDLNHPLAGKPLIFSLRLTGIKPAEATNDANT